MTHYGPTPRSHPGATLCPGMPPGAPDQGGRGQPRAGGRSFAAVSLLLPSAGIAARPGDAPMTTVDLAGRDRQIVQLIARFKQATSKQIHELLFSANASRTPADVALKRLTTRGYLHRIERRTVGGARGGSGQYVYALGRRGFFMFFEGRYSPARSVDYHALAILDSYIVLRRLELAGRLSIVGLSTEPDCW